MKKTATKWQQGVSLMEALVTLAVIGVIMLIFIPNFIRLLQSYRVQTTVSSLAVHLRFVRNAAVKQKILYRVQVQSESDSPSNRYIVEYRPYGTYTNVPYFQNDIEGGSHCNCVKMPSGIKILDSSTVTAIIFDARGGATGSGDIFVEGVDGTQYRIRVSSVGGVDPEKL